MTTHASVRRKAARAPVPSVMNSNVPSMRRRARRALARAGVTAVTALHSGGRHRRLVLLCLSGLLRPGLIAGPAGGWPRA